MKQLFNRIALGVCRLMPHYLVRHLLFLLRSTPELTDQWGYHIRPIHYYEPLPDFRTIALAQVGRRRTYPGIDFHLEGQIELITGLGAKYSGELEELSRDSGVGGFNFFNDYFPGLDAAVYYALIRALKPKRIVEIGCGYSTQIASKALSRNKSDGRPGFITCIEPFPEPRLTDAKLEVELIVSRVEDMDLELFSHLKANDILFIDSSHTVKFGNDVCREVLEILPVINPGVWVHVHDIFFPNDYPADWLLQRRYGFNEQYLLEGFMSFNQAFRVALSNYWLSLDHVSAVEKLWFGGQNVDHNQLLHPSSFWFYRDEGSEHPRNASVVLGF